MAKSKKTKPVKKVAKKISKKIPQGATKKIAKSAAKNSSKIPLKKKIVKPVPKKAKLKVQKVSKKVAPKIAIKKTVTSAIQKNSEPKKMESTSLAKKTKSNEAPALKIDFSEVLTPLDDRVLVQVKKEEKRTPGGLYIPDTAADMSGNLHGKVVSVGRGRRDKKGRIHPMDVTLGDQVVFANFTGNKIQILGQELIILHEAEVLGVVTK